MDDINNLIDGIVQKEITARNRFKRTFPKRLERLLKSANIEDLSKEVLETLSNMASYPFETTTSFAKKHTFRVLPENADLISLTNQLLWYGLSLGLSFQDTQDLTQDTFERAIKTKTNPREIVYYLKKIFLNRYKTNLEKKEKMDSYLESNSKTTMESYEQIYIEQESIKLKKTLLRKWINELPEIHQLPIKCIYLDELSHGEAQKKMELSRSNFNTTLHRARKKLEEKATEYQQTISS